MCVYLSKAKELLDTIHEAYTEVFPNTSTTCSEATSQNESSEKENQELELLLKLCRKIEKIGIEIYNNLNLSVICGSYAKNSHFEKLISEFIDKLSNLQPLEEIYDCLNNGFIKISLNSLKQYQRLTHSFYKKINTPYKRFLVNNYTPEILNPYFGELKIDLDSYAYLFDINIYLAYIDNSFALNKKVLRKLYDAEYDLKNHPLKDEIPCKIILDKCNLLISKFKTKYDNDEYFRSFSISHEFIDSDINPTQVSITYLKDFYDIIINLYPKNREDNHSYLQEYFLQKNGIADSFKDFFIFAQYYRKIGKQIKDFELLIANYEEKFKPKIGLDKFYDRSYYTCYNFLENNKISFWSKKSFENINDYHDINNMLIHIMTTQRKTGIFNFFPYYKLAKCYASLFQNILKQENFEANISFAKNILIKLEECTDYFDKYLLQNNRFESFHFQPNFNECCCEIVIPENQVIPVFIASSFIIPDDFNKFQDRLISIKADYQTFKTIIATQEFINSTKKENHALIEKVTKNSEDAIEYAKEKSEDAINIAHDSQKNNIQILSVFAALVVFAMGNFQVYRMVNTFQEALVFTLILAFSLSLFSIVIWFIVSKKEGKMSCTHKYMCGILTFGLIICSLAVFFGIGKNTPINPSSKPESAILDSINIKNISKQDITYPTHINAKEKDSVLTTTPKISKKTK